jgi:hypothetical protein
MARFRSSFRHWEILRTWSQDDDQTCNDVPFHLGEHTMKQGIVRSVLRWLPSVLLALALALAWRLFFSGGMRAVLGWASLIAIGQTLGPLTLLVLVIHAIRKSRFSAPMWSALGLALLSLWPALWSFGLFQLTFPFSRETTLPSATVRLPSNEPRRVAAGGDTIATNYHAYMPDQRWAYDLVVEPTKLGSSNLEDYGCYGTMVVAPVSARVDYSTDGEPDQVPGKLSGNWKSPLGNVVVFRLETGTYLLVAHMKPGSVLVKAGDLVKEGQPIGICGNSGNTSGPHIHIHHQRQDPKGRPINFAEGLPLYFRNNDGPAFPNGGIQKSGGQQVLTGSIVKNTLMGN